MKKKIFTNVNDYLLFSSEKVNFNLGDSASPNEVILNSISGRMAHMTNTKVHTLIVASSHLLYGKNRGF
jgi:hypothetical protein